MARLTKEEILKLTEGGLKLYQIYLPSLQMIGGRNVKNVDSIISKGKNCLSVFKCGDNYLFKDHSTGVSGNVFSFVALLNKLDARKDFIKVLEIITRKLNTEHSSIPEDKVEYYINSEDFSEIKLLAVEDSKQFVERHFINFHKYLEKPLRYKVQLVQSFAIYCDGNLLEYEYDFSKPTEAYYALEIIKEQYYLLYNPHHSKSYSWGSAPEFYLPGMEHLFRIAHLDNIYYRNNLVITNKIEGLLFLQDIDVPCLAVLDSELSLPNYIEEAVLPMFPHRYLLLGHNNNVMQHVEVLQKSHYFQYIMTKEFYLSRFLNKRQEAMDRIYEYLDFNDNFIYEGFESSISKVA